MTTANLTTAEQIPFHTALDEVWLAVAPRLSLGQLRARLATMQADPRRFSRAEFARVKGLLASRRLQGRAWPASACDAAALCSEIGQRCPELPPSYARLKDASRQLLALDNDEPSVL